jgi:hypothetical protein
MAMYKILLLTDQQLNRGSSPIDNLEKIDSEYATLTDEDKAKYNALVKGMFRDKYSTAAYNRAKAAEGTSNDIPQNVDKDVNLKASNVQHSESHFFFKLFMAALFFVFAYWYIRLVQREGVDRTIDNMIELFRLSAVFAFFSLVWGLVIIFLYSLIIDT